MILMLLMTSGFRTGAPRIERYGADLPPSSSSSSCRRRKAKVKPEATSPRRRFPPTLVPHHCQIASFSTRTYSMTHDWHPWPRNRLTFQQRRANVDYYSLYYRSLHQVAWSGKPGMVATHSSPVATIHSLLYWKRCYIYNIPPIRHSVYFASI